MLCLFPMEPPIYARHGVDARFVGHPLADAIAQTPPRAAARKALDRAFYEMVSCMIRQEPPAGNQGRTERAGRVAELLARFG